ncbi:MAG: hypothetical protein WCO98_03560 [bacterium]
MKKFCGMPAMAIILKISAVVAVVYFAMVLTAEITQISTGLKQMANSMQPIDMQVKLSVAVMLSKDLLFLIGIPSLIWLLADGAMLLRAMYFGDDCCEDDDEDGCCCGHDHSEIAAAPEAPVAEEKSAE